MDTSTLTQSPNPAAPTRPNEEIDRLGKYIYERHIRRQVEADHHGKIVAIVVDSGDWAIGKGVLEAADRLRTIRPEAVDVWGERIGYRALRSFGAGSLRRTD